MARGTNVRVLLREGLRSGVTSTDIQASRVAEASPDLTNNVEDSVAKWYEDCMSFWNENARNEDKSLLDIDVSILNIWIPTENTHEFA